jgi:lysine 2,3-aminomutase
MTQVTKSLGQAGMGPSRLPRPGAGVAPQDEAVGVSHLRSVPPSARTNPHEEPAVGASAGVTPLPHPEARGRSPSLEGRKAARPTAKEEIRTGAIGRTLAPTTLRSPADLAAAGLIPVERLAGLEAVAARYAVAVTPAMADLIDEGDAADPIARQFLPDSAELETRPQERADPIGDSAHEVVEGLIHRYPDRVLLKLVSVCAVYCRFCFRRETVGPAGSGALSRAAVDHALAYIGAHPQIWEVIVSGGDPLVAAPRRLAALTEALGRIDHVKVIRFHTRVPVVAPEKVTAALIDSLAAPGTTTWLAIHANHPRELTAEARAALARLADAGIPLVSQTVLLSGVNDDAGTLEDLMRALVECRVKPYYLHHGDLAPGTGHFRTTIAEGRDLMRALRGRVSGLCQPTYVLDIPGGHGKAPIGPDYLSEEDGRCRVEDFTGAQHLYPPETAET